MCHSKNYLHTADNTSLFWFLELKKINLCDQFPIKTNKEDSNVRNIYC